LNTFFNVTHKRWYVHKHMEVNAYMIVHNNLLTETWLEHFRGRLMKTYEKWKNTYKQICYWLMTLVILLNFDKLHQIQYMMLWFSKHMYMNIQNVTDGFWCILLHFVVIKCFGINRWRLLLIVSEVLYSKAWWLKPTNMCIKGQWMI
jgi:hypothetical protein